MSDLSLIKKLVYKIIYIHFNLTYLIEGIKYFF
jgi:hypothetical protein